MPDLPDKSRPSSAPLSAEDADRLADSFTPFWEDAGAPATSSFAAGQTPLPGTVTLPMPAVKPLGKQTLLGIAPINIEKPASAPPPPAAAPVTAPIARTQSVPASAPPPPAAAPVTVSVARSQTLSASPPPPPAEPVARTQSVPASAPPPPAAPVGFTQPLPPVAAAAPAPPTIERPAPSEPIQSSPEVPGYAIAYTPKDPPSTPAVVIAPEAQSSPENPPAEKKRREFSQTIPSRVRSTPSASVAPLAAPPSEDFNPYAPKKSKGKLIAFGLGGALLLLAVIGFLGSNGHEPSLASVPRSDVVPTGTAVTAAPTLSPAAPAETADPTPTSPAAAEPELAVAAPKRASEPAPIVKPKAKVKAKAKAESTSGAARLSTRAATAEPTPLPAKPASKGVIVRDAPF